MSDIRRHAFSTRYVAMDGLRAYAAGLVFLVHFCPAIAASLWGIQDLRLHAQMTATERFLYYAAMSNHGVDLFFILSGFLIGRMLRSGSFHYFKYLGRRVLRLYPAFLVTLGFAIVIKTAVYHFMPFNWSTVAMNVVFLNGIRPTSPIVMPYNAPTWSLFYEFLFYLSAPVLVVFRRWPRFNVCLAAALLIGALYTLDMLQYSRTIAFLSGAFVATFTDQRLHAWTGRLPDALVLLAYLCLTTASGFGLVKHLTFVAVFAVVGTSLVVQTSFGNGFLHRFFSLGFLQLGGKISYSFFLIHFTWLVIVVTEFERYKRVVWVFKIWIMAGCLLVVIAGGCIILSALCYRYFEAPYFGGRNRNAIATKAKTSLIAS